MDRVAEPTSLPSRKDAPAHPLNVRRPRIYRLKTGALHLTRAHLALGRGVSVQEVRLLAGGVRFDGEIGAGALKVVFVETEEMRLLGNRVNGEAMALACGGSRLDFAANLPGSALILHFSPAAARRVVTEGARPALRRRIEGPLGLAPLLCSVTQRGRALQEKARRLLARAEEEKRPRSLPSPSASDAIIEMSAELVAEILAVDHVVTSPGAKRRRELALTVENLLWETPRASGSRRLSLDDAAGRLRCSRRSIQLALHEEFGLGFIALKRAIRLQQVHVVLRRGHDGPAGVGRIAQAHEFNHLGRFSAHYRDMFGVLPSFDLPVRDLAGEDAVCPGGESPFGRETSESVALRKMDKDRAEFTELSLHAGRQNSAQDPFMRMGRCK